MSLFQTQSAELLHGSEPGNYSRVVLGEEEWGGMEDIPRMEVTQAWLCGDLLLPSHPGPSGRQNKEKGGQGGGLKDIPRMEVTQAWPSPAGAVLRKELFHLCIGLLQVLYCTRSYSTRVLPL